MYSFEQYLIVADRYLAVVLSLVVENVNLSLVLPVSELVVSCKVGDDGELLVVQDSLAVSELDTDGWF